MGWAGQPLIDRERELAIVAARLSAAIDGDGGALALEGPPGIGVSALLDETLTLGRAQRMELAVAAGSAYDRERPLSTVRRLLAGMDLEPGDEPDPARLCAEVAARSDARPLLLALDDVQLADAASIRFAALLSSWLRGRRALLVVALHPAPGLDALLRSVSAVVRVRPLGRSGVARLVEREAGAPVDEALAAACTEATGGNPARVVELVAEVLHGASGFEPAAARQAGALVVGRALRRLLEGPLATGVADAVAILADAATPERVAHVLGRRDGEVRAELDRFVATGVLVRADRPSFAAGAREPLLGSMKLVRRQELRLAASAALASDGELGEAGLQLLEVPPAGDPVRATLLRDAAAHVLEHGAPAVAITLLERLLAEPVEPRHRSRVLVSLGTVRVAIGDPAGVVTLRAALNEASDPEDVADAAGALGQALAAEADAPAVAEIVERARGRLGSDGRTDVPDGRLGVGLDVQVAELAEWDAALAPARRAAVARLERAAPHSPLARAALAGARAKRAFATCDPADRVVELSQRALAGGVLAIDPRHASTALTLVMLLGYSGRPENGLDHLGHLIARLRATNARVLLRPAVAFRGALAFMQGRLDAALGDLRTVFDTDGLDDHAPWQVRSTPLMAGFLIECLVERGDSDAATGVLATVDLDVALRDLVSHAPFLYARARLRLVRGDPHGALEDLLLCGARLEAGGWSNPAAAPWRGAAARILFDRGEQAEARRLTARELDLAEAFGAPGVVARALRDRAATLGPREARPLLERSVALADRSPSTLARAASLTDLGAALLEEGAAAEARERLRPALALAVAAGADPAARRAGELLHAAGGRPRRALPDGVGGLTEAERRVARLAAEGRTNREIADELFVTIKTVETHLGAAYRKLGIGSRAQLPTALHELGA